MKTHCGRFHLVLLFSIENWQSCGPKFKFESHFRVEEAEHFNEGCDLWQRCQPLETSNLKIFFRTSTPPPPRPNSPMWPPPRKFLSWFGPLTPPLPHRSISREKLGSICQGLQLVKYSSNQTRLYRSNKEETLFFLFATNNVHHARKWGQKP